MSEKEMGSVTGQAMLGLDVNEADGKYFTRYTVGTRSELQMNMEELALGEDSNCSGSANECRDVGIKNLSLGHIARQQENFAGNDYEANDIVPFLAMDPYLELAEEGGNVVGFRMGFTESRGSLSGSFESLTGRVGIELEDTDSGTVQDGELLQADGTADNQRATHFGLSDSAGCGDQCAPLTAIQTLDVGERDSNGDPTFTNDFLSPSRIRGWSGSPQATLTIPYPRTLACSLIFPRPCG